MDLVGTCPKTFWKEWLEEGDCAGEPETGHYYAWLSRHRLAHALVRIFDHEETYRFYVVAHGKLRGYAIVEGLDITPVRKDIKIIRKGQAVAVTIPEPIPGFRGLRKRWWDRDDEISFPDWRKP